ncbi:MAG: excisionase family DNA-binding protein [Candidatus Eisenbacteria bacterium]|nr:excisionase family DNA-binding protein [Candidatus Eisenbacteria bacterium]
MERTISPKEMADAIGVSESSVKRWVDCGRIEAVRTAGGHRRIPVPSVARFVRETRASLVKPELVGLHDLLAIPSHTKEWENESTDLFRFLESGQAAEARGLILSAYLSGRSLASIVDGPIRSAMARLGELWKHGAEGILIEHRATDICIQALDQIRLLISIGKDSPRAVGGAPSGDPYLLPSMATAAVLGSEGYQAVNLGPDTPVDILRTAARSMRPRIVWLSASAIEKPRELAAEVASLLGTLAELGAVLALGGTAREKLALDPHPALFIGSSMGELAGYARGRIASGPPAE